MDQALQDKLMQYLDAIERGVVEVTPKAYQMAVEVNYVAAIVNLITFIVALAIGWGIVVFCLSFPMKAAKKAKEEGEWFDFEEFFPAYAGAGFAGVLSFVGTLAFLGSTSMWVTLVNKDLGLVYTLWARFIG